MVLNELTALHCPASTTSSHFPIKPLSCVLYRIYPVMVDGDSLSKPGYGSMIWLVPTMDPAVVELAVVPRWQQVPEEAYIKPFFAVGII